MEPLTINKNNETHPLNSTWVIWYHNPSDNNWETSSYKKLYEISTLEDFYVSEYMEEQFTKIEFIYDVYDEKNG